MSYIIYWAAHCAAYKFNVSNFGNLSDEESADHERRKSKIREERRTLVVLAIHVLLHPRRKEQEHNSLRHAERAVVAVRAY